MVDYKGQKHAEWTMYIVLALFSTPGWIYGYTQDDFKPAFYFWAVGAAVMAVLVLPNWPFWNRNPIKWQKNLVVKEE